MNDRQKLLNELSKKIKKLENKIEHRKMYNIRNYFIKFLLKSGIAIDYALPFILSTAVISHIYITNKNAPFHIDQVKEKAKIETIDTSSGIHLEHILSDFSHDNKSIEYSTGWVTNKNGLYERTVTSYRTNKEINLLKTDEILSMSKEEIDNMLVVTNIHTIRKNALTVEDKIYDLDAIFVINQTESETKEITRPETFGENIWNTFLFTIYCLCWGNNIAIIEGIFVKTYLRDKLREYEHLFSTINKNELETIKKILDIKKENLAMIVEVPKEAEEIVEHPYKLRKEIK